MERLVALGLDYNQFITRLPDNCFTRLHELYSFVAVENGLTLLQNGLFDNLTKLKAVYFASNHISSIGEHLFDVTANLPNLTSIDLSHNNLTELDTWPVQRAQLIQGLKIYLSYNHISSFSNSLGWHYDCTSVPLLSETIDLTFNNISHLNDLLRGWNISALYASVLLRRCLKQRKVTIVYDTGATFETHCFITG